MKNTKERLIETATKMFAKNGFNGVSTRTPAQNCNVNLCSINYYFGSKQNLYTAVLDDILNTIQMRFIVPTQFGISAKKHRHLP